MLWEDELRRCCSITRLVPPARLRLGCDCLGHIEYLDAHLCNSRGGALTIANAICIHEEDYGILWKHTDRRLPYAPEVRRSRRLVVSSVSTVENYEYGFFWYFYRDGNIQSEIKLTGILSLATVADEERPKYGTVIAPRLYPPNHQHFFNMRLDFDIDGAANVIQQLDVVADPPGPDNPFENAFHVQARDLTSEQQALADLNVVDGPDPEDHQPGQPQCDGRPSGLQVYSRRQFGSDGLAASVLAAAHRLRQPPCLGDAVS